MKMRNGMKIRWLGEDGDLTHGELYTFRREVDGQVRIYEDGDSVRLYPPDQFEIVEIRPGAKVRWLGSTVFLMLTHNQIYNVLSVEKEWYRVIDGTGEDYLYPPEAFEIVDPG